jgi:hypothetical protein
MPNPTWIIVVILLALAFWLVHSIGKLRDNLDRIVELLRELSKNRTKPD